MREEMFFKRIIRFGKRIIIIINGFCCSFTNDIFIYCININGNCKNNLFTSFIAMLTLSGIF